MSSNRFFLVAGFSEQRTHTHFQHVRTADQLSDFLTKTLAHKWLEGHMPLLGLYLLFGWASSQRLPCWPFIERITLPARTVVAMRMWTTTMMMHRVRVAPPERSGAGVAGSRRHRRP